MQVCPIYQGCRALTFSLARLSGCSLLLVGILVRVSIERYFSTIEPDIYADAGEPASFQLQLQLHN